MTTSTCGSSASNKVALNPRLFSSLTNQCGTVRICYFITSSGARRDLHSFPTRRSSDLAGFYLIDAKDLDEAVQLAAKIPPRSEEHTSELQSPVHLVCRLLLEKKKPQSCSSSPCLRVPITLTFTTSITRYHYTATPPSPP